MKTSVLFIFLFFSFEAFAQEYDTITGIKEFYSNEVIKLQGIKINDIFVDTLFNYNPKGEITSLTIYGERALPRIVKTYQYIKGAGAMKLVGTYIQTDAHSMKKDGIWLNYRNDGTLMDSVIFDNGMQIYKARFNNGKIISEEKINGTID